MSNYQICVEVAPRGTMSGFVGAVQAAYDNGVEGLFRVIATRSNTWMVMFQRTTADDDTSYLHKQMIDRNLTDVGQAAMHQLADELADCLEGDECQELVSNLRVADAHIIDFDAVLHDVVATLPEPKAAKRAAKVNGDVDAALADLIEIISAGTEFPDALFRVSRSRNVESDALKEAYDAHCCAT